MKVNIREQERIKLMEHVRKHHFLKQKRRLNWEIGCWLGQEPTGRLFKVKASAGNDKRDEDLKRLADDMWDFLYTPKGEEILRAEAERGETWKNRLWNNWTKPAKGKGKHDKL